MARCAVVDLQTVQKLIAIFLASPHIARVRVLLCAQEVSAMCGRDRPGLALLSDRRLEWRCRTRRRRSRLALARARRVASETRGFRRLDGGVRSRIRTRL